jgi:hypothetical protein
MRTCTQTSEWETGYPTLETGQYEVRDRVYAETGHVNRGLPVHAPTDLQMCFTVRNVGLVGTQLFYWTIL